MLDDLFMPTHIILLCVFVLPLYFLPSIVAFSRRAEHYTMIALINVVLGITFLGWIAAFVWALADERLPSRQIPS